MTSSDLELEALIRRETAHFNQDFPQPRHPDVDEILVQRIARIRATHQAKKVSSTPMPAHFVGMVVGGRVQGVQKMNLLKDVVNTFVRAGWGINSSCQTYGDRIVIDSVHALSGFSIGFFLDKLGNPYLREKVTRQVNYYEPSKFEFAEEVYASTGKSWDFLSWEQKKAIVRLVDMARYSTICVVFDTPDNLSSMFVKFAAAYEKPVFFLPQDFSKMFDAVVDMDNKKKGKSNGR